MVSHSLEVDSLRNLPKEKIFATSAAVTFELSRQQTDQKPTINIEMASADSSGSGYDWKNKIAIQLTGGELGHFAAAILGYCVFFEAKRKKKGVTFQRQAGGMYMTASAAGNHHLALPIGPSDIFGLSDIVLSTLEQRSKSNGSTLALSLQAFRGLGL